ncbi:MAG: acyltransferase family protein, partial [Rhodospirillales bacterium]|nr:acyltransferase family protein [Acetobacter sp.]
MRAISILLVLAAHFIDDRLFPGGLGVYVFFVISGFLITRLLLAEHKTTGHVSLPSFYFRRVLRLFPVIIVFTLVILGLHLWLGRPIDLLEPASGLAYFANYLYAWMDRNGVATQMPFGIFWSLSVEEHFYILFPVTLILAGANPRRLLWLLGGLCLGCLGLRCVMAAIHPGIMDPRVVAKMGASLDRISGGRFA